MKFKTVSEFIHALEVEGKKFESSYEQNYNYFIGWRSGSPKVITKDTLAAHDFHEWKKVLTHDWQEYQPETEEIELVEWMWKGSTQLELDNFYYTTWITAGHKHHNEEAFKTGMTRKVKVPK